MWKKAIAEVMGTLFLVLIGTGAVVFGDSMLSIALAFGLIVIAMAYSIGTISGGSYESSSQFSHVLERSHEL